jgi:hypothetical protein
MTMLNVVRAFTLSLLLLQAAFVALFATAASSGDDLGIARALTIVLGVPFAAFGSVTGLLLWKGHVVLPLALSLVSAGVMAAAWVFA